MGRPEGRHHHPSLIAKENDDPDAVWKVILDEVDATSRSRRPSRTRMRCTRKGFGLAAKAPNAVVKVPMTPTGFSAGND